MKFHHFESFFDYFSPLYISATSLNLTHTLSPLKLSTTMKHKVSRRVISLRWVPFICISFFVLGAIFTSRFHKASTFILKNPFFVFLVDGFFCFCFRSWEPSSDSGSQLISQRHRDHELQIVSDDCAHKKVSFFDSN